MSLLAKLDQVESEGKTKIASSLYGECKEIEDEYKREHANLLKQCKIVDKLVAIDSKPFNFQGYKRSLVQYSDYKPEKIKEDVYSAILQLSITFKNWIINKVEGFYSVKVKLNLFENIEYPNKYNTDNFNEAVEKWKERCVETISLDFILNEITSQVGNFEDTAFDQLISNIHNAIGTFSEWRNKEKAGMSKAELSGKVIKISDFGRYNGWYDGPGIKIDWDWKGVELLSEMYSYFLLKDLKIKAHLPLPGDVIGRRDSFSPNTVFGTEKMGVKFYKNQRVDLRFQSKLKAEEFYKIFKLGEIK